MIKEKKVLVSVNSRNISHYKSFGYDINIGGFQIKIDMMVNHHDHRSFVQN